MVTLKWFNKEGISGGTFLVNIKDGITYTDNYNEELDSATVVLVYQDKINFEPFDMVELTIPELGTKTMLINDFVENEMNLDEGIYQYTINLMSKTKELERITLPSFSVTKAKNLAAGTLRQVLTTILNNYSPKYKINGNLSNIYTLNSPTGLNISCPDMQMTRPTLKEALNRVLSVKNSICVLNGNNEVEVMDLNERKNEITLNEYYNYKPENQSSNDYATETENNYNNVVPNEIDGIKNDTIVSEYKGFRSESMLVTDENAVLLTDNPIYDLKEVKWCGTFALESKVVRNSVPTWVMITISFEYNGNVHNVYTGADFFYFEIDITPYILESQNFDILDYESKKSHAYYTRGNNKIEGLLSYKKTMLENYITLDLAIKNSLNNNTRILLESGNIIQQIKNSLSTSEQETFDINNITNLRLIYPEGSAGTEPLQYLRLNNNANLAKYSMFKITYESQNENIRAKSSKYLQERNQNNIIVDNPGEAYVDIRRQGELFNQKVNRLGNRVTYLQARFPAGYDLPQLGDYYNDLVLIRRELSFYDDYILFKGTLSENYVNINYFTGINARKRSWNIIGPGEAFDKELLDKWYCVLDKNNYEGDEDLEFEGFYLAESLLNVFNYTESHPIVEHTWLSNDYTTWGDIGNKIELDSTSYIIGNSLIFNFKCDDNYSAGIAIQNPEETGGALEKYLRYTDDNGFANSFTLWLINKYEPNINVEIGEKIDDTSVGSDYGNLLEYSVRKPLLREYLLPNVDNITIYKKTITNWKDSREKLGFNIQFEFVSDSPDIIIGRQFLERQQLINIGARQDALLIRVSDHKYKITDSILLGNTQVVGNDNNIEVRYGAVEYKAEMSISNLSASTLNVKSIVITDLFNNLIMAINTDNYQSVQRVYLTMRRNRDRHNYLNKDLKTWR